MISDPDNPDLPPIKVVQWPHTATASVLSSVVALLVMAVALVIVADNVQEATDVANNIEQSAECRFDENAEISSVNDRIDLWTARGLAAVARDDSDGVSDALQHIDTLSNEFETLIAGRNDIVRRCD